MYSSKLKEKKLNVIGSGQGVSGVEVGKEQICKYIDEFCRAEDVIGVPIKTVYELFDDFCQQNGYPMFSHIALGRVMTHHLKVKRKKVRVGEKLISIYVADNGA